MFRTAYNREDERRKPITNVATPLADFQAYLHRDFSVSEIAEGHGERVRRVERVEGESESRQGKETDNPTRQAGRHLRDSEGGSAKIPPDLLFFS